MKTPTLCTVASGSGGHILPALIASQTWHKKNPLGSIIFCTGTATLDKKIISGYPFITNIYHFSFSKFSFKKCWLMPLILVQILFGCIKSLVIIIRHKPQTIIATGGLIALPICMVGRLLKSRIELYELNVIPGKAARILFPFVHVIFTPFENTKKHCSFMGKNFSHKCIQCTYPLRFSPQDKIFDKKEIIHTLSTKTTQAFTEHRKTLFILGGSQGSMLLNTIIKNFVLYNPEILPHLQIIHQTGNLDSFDWADFYRSKNIPAFIFAYFEHIQQCYQLADLIVCRAGAGTLFEIEFFAKPCIVIPLVSTTTSHQVDNARAMAEKHPTFFTVVEQKEMITHFKKYHQLILEKLFGSPESSA